MLASSRWEAAPPPSQRLTWAILVDAEPITGDHALQSIRRWSRSLGVPGAGTSPRLESVMGDGAKEWLAGG